MCSGAAILDHLGALKTVCSPAVLEVVQAHVVDTETQLKKYVSMVSKYTSMVGPLVKNLSDVKGGDYDLDWWSGVSQVLLIAEVLLTVLAAITCGLIVTAVMTTRGMQCPCLAKCSNIALMRMGGGFITFAILSAGALAAGECVLGTMGAAFCQNADANVLAYAKHSLGSGSDGYATVNFYITGYGANPFNQILADARSNLTIAGNFFEQLLACLGIHCLLLLH